MSMNSQLPSAIAVFCGSSIGKSAAYRAAAASLGKAMANDERPLIYGGGSEGIMGVVSGAVLEAGGKAIGVVPQAMVAADGECDKTSPGTAMVQLNEKGREQIETLVVGSTQERKNEMASRAGAFIGLPGGFGTYDEVIEATTWTQIGFHTKPVLVINVLGFYEPLRQLVLKGVQEGFIQEGHASLIIFVDGPADHSEHETFDWGKAALEAVDLWDPLGYSPLGYEWNSEKADN